MLIGEYRSKIGEKKRVSLPKKFTMCADPPNPADSTELTPLNPKSGF